MTDNLFKKIMGGCMFFAGGGVLTGRKKDFRGIIEIKFEFI